MTRFTFNKNRETLSTFRSIKSKKEIKRYSGSGNKR